MIFTYTWANAEQTSLKRVDAEGNIAYVPASEGNRNYAEFLASGETAADYVESPAPVDARTNEQKLEDATGLTVAELKAVLGITQLEADHQTLMNNNGGGY
jgi:hypothetical protein